MNKIVVNKSYCACCRSTALNKIYNFGSVPLAGQYINKNEKYSTYPLSISICEFCLHIQVDQYIDSNLLFKDYRYMSGFSMTNHFKNFLEEIKIRFKNLNNYEIVEIGSNDGTFLTMLSEISKHVIGFEPSRNISQISLAKGNNVINDFFSKDIIIQNNLQEKSKDLITASNCFAHISEIDEILDSVKYLLKPETGTFIIEVHYTPNLIKELQYDFIYHEHMYYYSISSLNALLKRKGMQIYDYEFIPVHGGSIRIYSKVSNSKVLNSKILQLIEKEINYYKLNVAGTILSDKIHNHIQESKNLFIRLKNQNKSIVGFGASGRVNAFLNYINIDTSIIDYILDESPERANRYIPQVNIPVLLYESTSNYKFDILYLSAWNFSEKIIPKFKNSKYNSKIQFFPEIIHYK